VERSVRLFTAIEIDPAVREEIAAAEQALVRTLGDAAREFRFVGPEQLHLTLVFIGNVDADRAPAFIETMSAGIPVAPFRLSFGAIGTFPSRGAAGVLWLAVTDAGGQLARVERVVADRLEPLGVPRETRPFVPHLTLARRRHPGSRRETWTVDRPFSVAATTPVAGVSLFSSQLSPPGSRYTRLATAALTGGR
jgi:2'-5' RNA ligase